MRRYVLWRAAFYAGRRIQLSDHTVLQALKSNAQR
jgi:hypothetical protein